MGPITKKTSIKKWYEKEYPTDELGSELNPTISFNKLYNLVYTQQEFYKNLNVFDSLVRERIFSKLADLWIIIIYTICG